MPRRRSSLNLPFDFATAPPPSVEAPRALAPSVVEIITEVASPGIEAVAEVTLTVTRKRTRGSARSSTLVAAPALPIAPLVAPPLAAPLLAAPPSFTVAPAIPVAPLSTLPVAPSLPVAPLPAPPPTREEPAPRDTPAVITVGELDRRLKRLVEERTLGAHVEGEISGLREAASGHIYFTLKDGQEDAAIDAVMYRTAPARSRRLLAEGARVVLIGRATIYAPRGRLQFTADEARPVGRGALLEALERLKEKLAGEGLFAPEKKRPLPPSPRVIGVVTSGTGAAIHDIITVASRRARVRILLARAAVQGPGAAAQMIRALELLERVPEVEVIILGRGGGSADDLAAFNDEALVRKVKALRVPLVSAVGHEIDVSLTDLAADARAATPSQAAELLVPDAAAQRGALAHLAARMARAVGHARLREQARLDKLTARLGSPERLLNERQQELDDELGRLQFQMEQRLARDKSALAAAERLLEARHPRAVIHGARAALSPLEARLGAAMRRALAREGRALAGSAARLSALSPLDVLGRGYALASNHEGALLRDAREVNAGEEIHVRLARGRLKAKVLEASPNTRPDMIPAASPAPLPPGAPPPSGEASGSTTAREGRR